MITIVICFCICYLPYKIYLLMIKMGAIAINVNVLYTFTVGSFLNRCLNPFIYSSQYEVVRRTWSPVVEFLRRRVTGTSAASTVVKVEPAPAPPTPLSHPAG